MAEVFDFLDQLVESCFVFVCVSVFSCKWTSQCKFVA